MLWAALVTGLIGSLHCAGMCGPLLCAMPIKGKAPAATLVNLLLYNSGRIFSYALLGVLMGLGGALVLRFTGIWFTYVAGVVLVLWGLLKLFSKKNNEPKMPPFMRRWMGKLFRRRSAFMLPLLGMLNGIIPCGAVYAALAGASVTAGPGWGALYMLVFGLATWPALFAGYYVVGKISLKLRRYYRPATAVFMCLLGALLLMRATHDPLADPKPAKDGIGVCG